MSSVSTYCPSQIPLKEGVEEGQILTKQKYPHPMGLKLKLVLSLLLVQVLLHTQMETMH